MKPLLTNQKVLTWLCICPADETTRKWQKFIYIGISFAIIAMKMSVVVSSMIFLLKNLSSDLNAALFAFLQIVGMSGMIYTFITGLLIRLKIRDSIQSLVEIYEKSIKSIELKFGTKMKRATKIRFY